jgi:hyaluronoglucosaminidase
MNLRGVIEGFYGPPWTHEERLDLIAFCGKEGLTTWVHAPKDDPYHRKLWREPYPDPELEQLAALVAAAGRHGVEFVYAIAPGLSIRASDDADLAALEAKREQVLGIGVRDVQLLWDDIEREWIGAADQADVSNRFAAGQPLVVCPMGYAGSERTPYRDVFGAALDPQIVCYWTGPEVVPTAITRAELDGAVEAFGHELLLWDNYPVNDFAPETLFLGPLRGREPALAEGRCAGIVANAMLQAVPSKLPLATVADWARDPHGYDPLASLERALRAYGAEVVESLHRLAGTGPGPDAPGQGSDPGQTPTLAALVAALAPGVDAATGAALLEPFV